jgi:hypothetical protein
MQRTVTAVAFGALVLTGSACTGGGPDGAESSATASPPAASAAGTARAVATPGKAPDYAANTKKICTGIDRLLVGKQMDRFATELGTIILHTDAKDAAKANAARAGAQKELRALAGAVRKQTAAAKDPNLRAAGRKGAESIEGSAADRAFFARVKSVKTVEKVLEAEMISWISPFAMFCA